MIFLSFWIIYVIEIISLEHLKSKAKLTIIIFKLETNILVH